MPRGLFHVVDRLDQPTTHEPRPQPIDHRAGQPAVCRADQRVHQLIQPHAPRGGGIDAAEIRVEELHGRGLAGRTVALHHLERPIGVDAGQAVRVGQLPFVDEAVVARRALEIHPHEDLRDVLRGLHLRRLAGIDDAAPHNPLGEAFGAWHRVDQRGDELVVRQVVGQRGIQPRGDLAAPAVDVAGAAIVVAQQVVPETQPVLGVAALVGEQPRDQALALVGSAVGDKRPYVGGRRQFADHVERQAPDQQPVVNT